MIPCRRKLRDWNMAALLAVAALTSFGVSEPTAQEISEDATAVRVLVFSDPPDCRILLDTVDQGLVTPDTLVLSTGREFLVSVEQDGYEPLSQTITTRNGDRPLLEFILLLLPPEPPSPEDLGMSYELILPLLPDNSADGVREKFRSLAEVFLVVPCGQGAIAKLAFSGDHSFPSDKMFYGGVGLVVSSIVLSRILHKRKLNRIHQANEVLEASNTMANSNNQEVDRAIHTSHAEQVILWQRGSEIRGRVLIKDY